MDGHGVWVDIRASMHMARDELLDQAIRLAYQISPPAGRV